MRRIIRHIFCTLSITFVCLVGVSAQSKPPKIGAKFIPDSIAIGDQFRLEVTIEKDMMQFVDLPSFKDSMLTQEIEILEEFSIDTISKKGRKIVLRKKYLLTTFEEGIHPLGRFPALYVDKNIVDTLYSVDSLILQVGTFEIDTLTMTIRDIKPTLGAPRKFGEFSEYLGWGLLFLAVIALVVWIIISRRKNLTMFGKAKPVEPPHVIAIKALEILHSQKLWQNNKHKQYYTCLTDILRDYLDGRYGIPALEMTSVEILSELRKWKIEERQYSHLKDILSTSDLVKFAKLVPVADENETAYTNAYYFVESTKPTEIEEGEGIPEEIVLD